MFGDLPTDSPKRQPNATPPPQLRAINPIMIVPPTSSATGSASDPAKLPPLLGKRAQRCADQEEVKEVNMQGDPMIEYTVCPIPIKAADVQYEVDRKTWNTSLEVQC